MVNRNSFIYSVKESKKPAVVVPRIVPKYEWNFRSNQHHCRVGKYWLRLRPEARRGGKGLTDVFATLVHDDKNILTKKFTTHTPSGGSRTVPVEPYKRYLEKKHGDLIN